MAKKNYPAQAIKGVCQTTPPSLAQGDENPLSLDASGALRTAGSPSAPSTASYRYVFGGASAPGAGQFFELRNPAASGKTIKVTTVWLTKPSVTTLFTVRQQTALSTGGTAAAGTAVKLATANAAAVAVLNVYSAVPVQGAGGSVFEASLTAGDSVSDTPGSSIAQPITLAAGESLAISTDVAATIRGMVEWTEE